MTIDISDLCALAEQLFGSGSTPRERSQNAMRESFSLPPLYPAPDVRGLLETWDSSQGTRSSGLLGDLPPFTRVHSYSREDLKRAAWVRVAGSWDEPFCWCPASGRFLRRDEYGMRTSSGWDVDHYPIRKKDGGMDHPLNVRARHWLDNQTEGGFMAG